MKYEEVCNTITSMALPAQQPIDGETINIDIGEKIDNAKKYPSLFFSCPGRLGTACARFSGRFYALAMSRFVSWFSPAAQAAGREAQEIWKADK